MIIKSADDKSKRLKLLEGLQQSSRLDAAQKDWLSRQLRNLRNGIAGERDAAHYIDSHYRDRSTHAVIHDLRIQVGDEIAQIDHLVISRGMHFYLLETKSFNGDLFINDHGEFSVRYGGDAIYGIPSRWSKAEDTSMCFPSCLRNWKFDVERGVRTTITILCSCIQNPTSSARAIEVSTRAM